MKLNHASIIKTRFMSVIQVKKILSAANHLTEDYMMSRGRMLRRNPDKIRKSFPPCYSQSPTQHCLEISISSNSHNLLQFLQFQLLYAVKEKGAKHDRNPFRNLKCENSQDYTQQPQRNCMFMNSDSVHRFRK
jgi:hypothetical protein